MLALICGAGDLPRAVATAHDGPVVVCALEGFAPAGLTPEMTFRLETLGSLLAWLKARGVTRVCLCGAISRPAVDLGAVDDATAPLLPTLAAALRQGDDGALRAVLGLFQDAGFAILAAHEAAPALLPPSGVLSKAPLPPSVRVDAAAGDAALAQMGDADLGQACVIQGGTVIAREGADGTDAMLAGLRTGRSEAADPFSWAIDQADAVLGAAADWLSGPGGGPIGFLFKAPKPGQDRRADLPVIGPGTVAAVAQAGLKGIVIEAGGVMVLHQTQTRAAADAAGLFLWVRERPA